MSVTWVNIHCLNLLFVKHSTWPFNNAMRGLKINTTLEPITPAGSAASVLPGWPCIDTAMKRGLERWHSKVICQHWLANTTVHEHVIPFQNSHCLLLAQFDLAVSQFGGCQREKHFLRIGHVTCKSRDNSVNHAITAIWLALSGFWQGTLFSMESH